MSTVQNDRIEQLRRENYSYRFIADTLQLSPNTVKSICRRRGYIALGSRKTKAEKLSARFCKNCGVVLPADGNFDQKFCSDSCRRKWWKLNRKVTEK